MDRDELVKLAGEKLASSIFRDAPTDLEHLDARPVGDISGQEVRVFLYRDVLDELAFAASYRQEPSFAILMGAFAVDEQGPFLEVTGFSRFQYTAGLDSLYHNVKDQLDELTEERTQYPSAQHDHVVGVFVAAPGCDGELPAQVARTHLSLFNVPYQLAVVVDPDSGKLGVHARAPASRFYNSPFWVVEYLDDQTEDQPAQAD